MIPLKSPDNELQPLLVSIAQHEQPALAAFYDATVSRVYGLALRVARNPAAAEEIVEDVYLQVWKSAASYEPARGQPLTWLLTICRSRALDYLRRQDRAEPHPEPEQLCREEDREANDPQDLLLATERSQQLHEALKQLSAVQRQLLALAFFRGLTHEEISTQAAMPLGTVKTHVRRALQSLRESLTAYCKIE